MWSHSRAAAAFGPRARKSKENIRLHLRAISISGNERQDITCGPLIQQISWDLSCYLEHLAGLLTTVCVPWLQD